MDVEQDAEAAATHEHRNGLCQRVPAHRGGAGQTVDAGGQMPRGGGTQRDGQRGEDHLHHPDDAGVGVAVDDIPHGVGDEKSRPRRDIGRQRHTAGRQQGAEEGVGLLLVHKVGDEADDQAHRPRPQAVQQRAAEHQAEAQTHQHAAQIEHAGAVGAARLHGLLQPRHGLVHVGTLRADAAAQGVELFQRLQIVAVEADTLHDHQRLAVGRLQADGHAVGDGEHLALHAVGPQDAVDGVLHPEGLRAGHGQMVPHGSRQIGQQIVVHTNRSPVSVCRMRPSLHPAK